jgi:LAS superfamily LD-carboxypeptidase LdcB
MSGYRTRAAEEAGARRNTNRLAFGAFSPHALGLAADVSLKVGTSAHASFAEASTVMTQLVTMLNSPAYKWIYMNGATYGFYQYRNEPWHWEYNPSGFKATFWSEADDAIRAQPFAQPAPATLPRGHH